MEKLQYLPKYALKLNLKYFKTNGTILLRCQTVSKLVFIPKLTPINESAGFCVEITKQKKTFLKRQNSS